MARAFSRRGLFRALTAARPVDPGNFNGMYFAKIGSACVEPKGVTCRRCGDVCDAQAIRFRLMGGGRAVADLDEDVCTGCGECLAVCPVDAIELVSRERTALVADLVGAHVEGQHG